MTVAGRSPIVVVPWGAIKGDDAMKVKVHLKTQSNPVEIDEVRNAYEKGSFYCVMLSDKVTVHKFPIADIFRVTETSDVP